MTNGERIRQMTDEELLEAIGLSCQRCVYYYLKYLDKPYICKCK